ncbi:hypothetical protein BX600DRAFT_506695 [Xylariales sp. PMI_506]|nr:hypothetical protein BX600DRAFT_506695 [Xylariales sp. PMI_506]
MNAPRIALERAVPSAVAHFTRVPSQAMRSSCPHFLRQFSQSQIWTASSQAVPSYHSYPLPSPPPRTQPRNTDAPETSITSPIPKVFDTRPPKPPVEATSPTPVPEPEAQKVKPTERKRKLRPRKAAMKLTPSAVERLREMLEGPEPKLIKVGVRNRGCSGLAYHLDYVDKPGPFDEEVDQDGVKVLIDSKALFSIIGSEMDWVEDKLNQRFVFTNPNIKEECGCGESFMV